MIREIAISSDGRTLVIAEMAENFAQVWELDSLTEIGSSTVRIPRGRSRMQHDAPVRSVVVSRDGRRIVTGSYDGTARQWNAATGEPIGEPLKNRGQVGAVAISRNSRFILTGTDERHAQLWRADTGRPAGMPLRHDGTVRGVAFSPDGQLLATASWDKTARFWPVVSPIDVRVDEVVQWVEIWTGMTLDSGESAQVLDAASWKARRDRLR